MCGIIAVINTHKAERTAGFMKDALIASQLRGTDSTGMFQVSEKNAVTMFKKAINALDYVNDSTGGAFVQDTPNCRLSVGHVRAATSGSVGTLTAHPFRSTRSDGSYIIGVHNGTLNNWRNKVDAGVYEVDSEWALSRIAEDGADAFEYIQGAYTFMWYDSREPDSLYVCRNKDRPMFYVVDSTKQTALFASELPMLQWVAERNGIYPTKGHTGYYLMPGKLYKFSLDNAGEFTESLLPEVDYTAGFPVSPKGNVTNLYPNRSPLPDYNSYGLVDDDWDYEDSMWGRYRSTSSRTWKDYKDLSQDKMLTGIKDALRKVRYNKMDGAAEPHVVEVIAANLPAVLALEDMTEQASAGPERSNIDFGQVKLRVDKTHRATAAEVVDAQDMKYYGLVVNFQGIWYDQECSSLMGTFTTYEKGKWELYEATLRNVPSSVAHTLYINRKGSVAMVVVGLDITEDMVYLDELTSTQREFIQNSDACDVVH